MAVANRSAMIHFIGIENVTFFSETAAAFNEIEFFVYLIICLCSVTARCFISKLFRLRDFC